jgi:hypothetical protein
MSPAIDSGRAATGAGEGWKMIAVAPAALHRYWPLVRAGFETVRRKACQAWWAEDLYAAVLGGRAQLCVGTIGGRLAGAAVVCLDTEPYGGERSLLIWAAFSLHPAALRHGLREFEQIARAHGVARLRFVSPRRGFARRMAAAGFQVTQRTYEKVI